MKIIEYAGLNYVLLPVSFAGMLKFGQVFQLQTRSTIFKAIAWDFDKEIVLAVNIEDSSDLIKLKIDDEVIPLEELL